MSWRDVLGPIPWPRPHGLSALRSPSPVGSKCDSEAACSLSLRSSRRAETGAIVSRAIPARGPFVQGPGGGVTACGVRFDPGRCVTVVAQAPRGVGPRDSDPRSTLFLQEGEPQRHERKSELPRPALGERGASRRDSGADPPSSDEVGVPGACPVPHRVPEPASHERGATAHTPSPSRPAVRVPSTQQPLSTLTPQAPDSR